MLDLHGLIRTLDTAELLKAIQSCCDDRDQFVHGVWIRDDNGIIAVLRLTRGTFETPDGKADRSFLPEGLAVPDDAYAVIRENILSTVRRVSDLKREVKAFLSR